MNHVFVSFPFKPEFNLVFEVIRKAADRLGLKAIRVDEIVGAPPLPDEIARLIREARLVIADLTGNNPNVLYEVGRAAADDKPLVLITQDEPPTAAFAVRHRNIVRYAVGDLPALENRLDKVLEEMVADALLRAMLVPSTLGRPTSDSRFVVAASPLSFRRAFGRQDGFEKLRRTSSDHVGIRGLLQSFGLLFDFDIVPDILDPEDYKDDVHKANMNVYCIASPKANRWTRDLLTKYAEHWSPKLQFHADPESPDVRNVRLSILRDGQMLLPDGWPKGNKDDRTVSDFGLIVRGPNPFHADRMMTILAGRGALGTEAACAALTDAKILRRMRDMLAGRQVDIDDHRQPFFAIVSLKRSQDTMEAIPASLKLHDAFGFERIS